MNLKSLDSSYIPQISQIHIQVFPKSVWTKLGRLVVERFYLWQLTGPHPVVEVIGAFVNDQLVGFILTGIFNESTTGFIRNNRSLLVKKVLVRPWLLSDGVFMQRLTAGYRLFRKSFLPRKVNNDIAKNNNRKSYGLLSMGVLSEYQNLGIGTALMKEVENKAAAQGYEQVHLTVDPINAKAIHVYEKLGWQKAFEPDEVWKGTMRKNLAR